MARALTALLAAALLAGCGEPESRFGVDEIRAEVGELAGESDQDSASIALFRRVVRDLDAIELGELPDAVALPVPRAEIAARRPELVRWGRQSDVARSIAEALLPLADADVPLRLAAGERRGALARLEIPRIFELTRRVSPRILALAADGEVVAALDLLAAWTEFTRGACAFGPSGAPLAAMSVTQPETTASRLGLEWVLGLGDRDAARFTATLRRAPAVAGWAAHGYLSDVLLVIEDDSSVESELIPHRATFFDPDLLAALADPLAMERAAFRDVCEAAVGRTPLTEIALRDYAGEWDVLAAGAARVAAIDAFRAAAAGRGASAVVVERGALRITIAPDLASQSATWRVDGEPSVGGAIEL